MNEPVVLVLEGERAPSWNKLTAHQHWTKLVQENHRLAVLVRAAFDGAEQVFDCPVHIRIDAYYRNAVVDSDNVMAKGIIDSLKGWIIKDDDRHCVRDVTTCAHFGDNKVVITITPVE